MAFHRNNNGNNNRYNNRQNFRPRHNNQHQQQGGQRRHVNRINHVFESNGPDGRVRGTAQQLVEKYVGLARDAHAAGDPVLMLNYYQHAEHYQRVYAEIMEENGAFEREREAQRAQHNQQPTVDGDANFAPDTTQPQQPSAYQQQQSDSDGFSQPRDRDVDTAPRQARDTTPQQFAPQADAPAAGSMSTGGRVMGRRPAARADGRPNQGNQLQDDHMPSFLKKDIPIKQAAPPVAKDTAKDAAPAKTAGKASEKASDTDGGDAPVAAAFGKRRAPARRAASTPDDAADA